MQISTRDKIIAAGAEIILRKGFNFTGLQEILSAVNVPKGSFYNFFDNKEDFGLQVIDYFMSHYHQMATHILDDTSIAPLKRIRKILETFMDHFQSTNYTGGCPIGNLAQEMGDLSPAFRNKLRMALDAMVDAYSRVLAEAQATGEIPTHLDVQKTAYFIVASWHGAIIRMKLVGNSAPLENHCAFIFDHILKI